MWRACTAGRHHAMMAELHAVPQCILADAHQGPACNYSPRPMLHPCLHYQLGLKYPNMASGSRECQHHSGLVKEPRTHARTGTASYTSFKTCTK